LPELGEALFYVVLGTLRKVTETHPRHNFVDTLVLNSAWEKRRRFFVEIAYSCHLESNPHFPGDTLFGTQNTLLRILAASEVDLHLSGGTLTSF